MRRLLFYCLALLQSRGVGKNYHGMKDSIPPTHTHPTPPHRLKSFWAVAMHPFELKLKASHLFSRKRKENQRHRVHLHTTQYFRTTWRLKPSQSFTERYFRFEMSCCPFLFPSHPPIRYKFTVYFFFPLITIRFKTDEIEVCFMYRWFGCLWTEECAHLIYNIKQGVSNIGSRLKRKTFYGWKNLDLLRFVFPQQHFN